MIVDATAGGTRRFERTNIFTIDNLAFLETLPSVYSSLTGLTRRTFTEVDGLDVENVIEGIAESGDDADCDVITLGEKFSDITLQRHISSTNNQPDLDLYQLCRAKIAFSCVINVYPNSDPASPVVRKFTIPRAKGKKYDHPQLKAGKDAKPGIEKLVIMPTKWDLTA